MVVAIFNQFRSLDEESKILKIKKTKNKFQLKQVAKQKL